LTELGSVQHFTIDLPYYYYWLHFILIVHFRHSTISNFATTCKLTLIREGVQNPEEFSYNPN